MAKITIPTGGNSDEREISLRSANAVSRALQTAGHTTTLLDINTASVIEICDADVVFPVMHGLGAEDGTLQAELEKRGVPFVGTGSEASALCFDKGRYREFVKTQLPIPEGALVTNVEYHEHQLAKQPFALKPFDGGSSVDTFIMRDMASVPVEAIEAAFQRHDVLLLEQLIQGPELTVGVLGSDCIGIIEIIPPADGEFDYENKYNGKTQELCPPEHLSEEVQAEARRLAEIAHEMTGCRDFSRTDMMLDESTGKLYVLETNTIPGMTDQSLFPKMAAHAGLSMPELCNQLVQMALNR